MLNGMFAFAVYDKVDQKVWLVRDPLGIKPLYYRFTDQGLSFASEIKALVAVDSSRPHCDRRTLHEWLYFGNSLGTRTLFSGIRQMLPGHVLELDLRTFESSTHRYWSPAKTSTKGGPEILQDDVIQQTSSMLEQAVRRHLVSDVPVGVFLSGGIDSSAITAFGSKHYPGKLATYSVGFDFDKGVNELDKAKKVANLYGTDHHELHISGTSVADTVVQMVDHHDLPFSDAANIPLFLLSSEICETKKVVLQGDGGDEVFGGYSRYTTLHYYRTARLLAKIARVANLFFPRDARFYRRQRYINALKPRDVAEVMALLLTEEDTASKPASVFSLEMQRTIFESDPFARYRECQDEVRNEDIVNQMMLVDALIILPDIFLQKVDRVTMAASVEVRVPFLDKELVEFCMRLPGAVKVRLGRKKWLLKQALKGIVPDDVLNGPKTGFGVPYKYWLGGPLRPLFFDHLHRFCDRQPGVLDQGRVAFLYDQFVTSRQNCGFLLWKLMNFMIWSNRHNVSI
jgi:asparagine synthase (glutamine-hydrolysing)